MFGNNPVGTSAKASVFTRGDFEAAELDLDADPARGIGTPLYGTGSLHGVGVAPGLIHSWAGRMALRAAEAAVTAGGLYFPWEAPA